VTLHVEVWNPMFRTNGNRLQILCSRLHYFENILSQVVTLEICNSMFKNIGNQLHAHGNRLLLCKTVIKLFWASGNRLLPYGNRLPESKNSGKRFFFEKFFWTNCVIQSFLWKILFILILMLFLRFLHILSLLLNLHLNLLDSLILFEWIFNSLWHHQNNLGSFASTISPFLMMTNLEIKRIYAIFDLSFTHLFSTPFFLNLCLI